MWIDILIFEMCIRSCIRCVLRPASSLVLADSVTTTTPRPIPTGGRSAHTSGSYSTVPVAGSSYYMYYGSTAVLVPVHVAGWMRSAPCNEPIPGSERTVLVHVPYSNAGVYSAFFKMYVALRMPGSAYRRPARGRAKGRAAREVASQAPVRQSVTRRCHTVCYWRQSGGYHDVAGVSLSGQESASATWR